VSDAYGQVIWTRNFVAALGQIVGPVQLQQDNLSTMALLRNGRSNSSRTRHIDIRYFFMSDAAGEVVVAYRPPTEQMIADISPQGPGGAQFVASRAELINSVMEYL
jgi:hypothetical protein